MDQPQIKVGIGVVVFKDGKILLHKRKNAHGAGEYAAPGGHLEYMESIEQGARRECREEAGIEIVNVRFLDLINTKTYAPKHYVTIGMVADWKSGEPKVMEPEKCESWEWYDIDHLPQPLFSATTHYIETLKTGKSFFDA